MFDYSEIEPGHYDVIYEQRRGLRSKWHHQKFARVRALMGDYRRHLDIGCGPGTFVGTLPGPGFSIGIDIAGPQVEFASGKYAGENRVFLIGGSGGLPFCGETFDVVTMIELIEHLPEEQSLAVLGEIRRVLRPGGALIVTTPNYGGLWPALEILVNRLGTINYEHQHVRKYDRASLHRLITAAGLKVERLETWLLFAPFVAALGWQVADWAERIEPVRLRARFGHLLMAKALR